MTDGCLVVKLPHRRGVKIRASSSTRVNQLKIILMVFFYISGSTSASTCSDGTSVGYVYCGPPEQCFLDLFECGEFSTFFIYRSSACPKQSETTELQDLYHGSQTYYDWFIVGIVLFVIICVVICCRVWILSGRRVSEAIPLNEVTVFPRTLPHSSRTPTRTPISSTPPATPRSHPHYTPPSTPLRTSNTQLQDIRETLEPDEEYYDASQNSPRSNFTAETRGNLRDARVYLSRITLPESTQQNRPTPNAIGLQTLRNALQLRSRTIFR